MNAEPKVIPIPLQELRGQKPVNVEQHVLILYPDKLRWIAEFEAEEHPLNDEGEENTTLPRETFANFYDITVYKEAISGVFIEFNKFNRLFNLNLLCRGFDSNINVYFKTKAKAVALRDELVEWMGIRVE
jgi:hypothetical protein